MVQVVFLYVVPAFVQTSKEGTGSMTCDFVRAQAVSLVSQPASVG